MLSLVAMMALPAAIAVAQPDDGMLPPPPPNQPGPMRPMPPQAQPGQPGQPGRLGQPGQPGRPGQPGQPQGEGPFFRPGPGEEPTRPQPGPGMDGEFERRQRERIEQLIERMTEALGLSGEEAEKFQGILREAEAQRQKMREEMAERMRGIEEKQRERLGEFLDEEQMAQLERFMRRAGEFMRQGGPQGGQNRPDRAERPDVNRLMDEMGLTEEQRRRVQGLMRGFEEAQRELRRLGEDPNVPKEQLAEQMRQVQEAIDAQLRQILSPEQFEQYQQFRKGMGQQPQGPTQPGPQNARPNQGRDPVENMLERLGLEGEAREQFAQLMNETRQRIREAIESRVDREQMREKLEQAQAEMMERAKEMLTPEQFEKFQEGLRGFNRGNLRPNRPNGPNGAPNGPGNDMPRNPNEGGDMDGEEY